MKFTSRISIAIVACLVFTVLLTGCTDITKSNNYQTHKLKYQVNLTNVEEDKQEETTNEVQNNLQNRLNNFDVAGVQINQESENEKQYLTIEFGTIDDIKAIKKYLEKDDTFLIKKKIDDESDYKVDIENKANDTLNRLNEGAQFETTAQNEVLSDPERIIYSTANKMYRDEIKEVFAQVVFDIEPGTIYSELIKYTEPATIFSPEIEVIAILKLSEKETVDRVTTYTKEVKVSHILVAYEGAMRASEDIKRTKERTAKEAGTV